jgi:hypothetical protein
VEVVEAACVAAQLLSDYFHCNKHVPTQRKKAIPNLKFLKELATYIKSTLIIVDTKRLRTPRWREGLPTVTPWGNLRIGFYFQHCFTQVYQCFIGNSAT